MISLTVHCCEVVEPPSNEYYAQTVTEDIMIIKCQVEQFCLAPDSSFYIVFTFTPVSAGVKSLTSAGVINANSR